MNTRIDKKQSSLTANWRMLLFFFFIDYMAFRILVPQPGIEPRSPLQWKCRVQTAKPPGNSLEKVGVVWIEDQPHPLKPKPNPEQGLNSIIL